MAHKCIYAGNRSDCEDHHWIGDTGWPRTRGDDLERFFRWLDEEAIKRNCRYFSWSAYHYINGGLCDVDVYTVYDTVNKMTFEVTEVRG